MTKLEAFVKAVLAQVSIMEGGEDSPREWRLRPRVGPTWRKAKVVPEQSRQVPHDATDKFVRKIVEGFIADQASSGERGVTLWIELMASGDSEVIETLRVLPVELEQDDASPAEVDSASTVAALTSTIVPLAMGYKELARDAHNTSIELARELRGVVKDHAELTGTLKGASLADADVGKAKMLEQAINAMDRLGRRDTKTVSDSITNLGADLADLAEKVKAGGATDHEKLRYVQAVEAMLALQNVINGGNANNTPPPKAGEEAA